MISVATDGAPNMLGTQQGFVSLLQRALDRKLLTFHCMLHQEALCTQTFTRECNEMMNLVIRVLNKIIAQELNHRQFRSLLDELDSTYPDLRLHNKVRWLSRGEVLKRFAVSLEHVKTFLKIKGLSSRIGSARLGRKVAFHGGYDIAPQHVKKKPARKR